MSEENDRELLELAAKALGLPKCPEEWKVSIEMPVCFTYMGKPWNPLTDDGDALRLAVKLRITPRLGRFGCDAGDGGRGMAYERYGSDCGVATRRAIVRAAAEIGRAMA